MRQYFPDQIKLGDDKIVCYLIDLHLFDDETVKTCLSHDEVKRADKFRVKEKRQQFVVTRALLRQLLSRCLVDTRPESIVFHYQEHGKPYVDYAYMGKPINFNVSHSNHLALLAFTLTHDIGVDIEKMEKTIDYLTLGRRFFSDLENQQMAKFELDKKRETFYRIWTRKEAFIKGEGSGIAFGLGQFSVSSDEAVSSSLIHVDESKDLKHNWYNYDATCLTDYQSALASTAQGLHVIEHVIVN